MSILYKEIASLRNLENDTQRGYKFEQAIREIQPWDRKPAIAISITSEQLDGIFVWKDKPYLIESKAKKDVITVGSHDWEDFELKVRRRKSAVTGIFCSLFSVSEEVYERARDLIKDGHFVLVFAGDFWDELEATPLLFKDVLEYMNFHGRVRFLGKPPKLKIINDWCFDKELIEKAINNNCKKVSSTFLRRYKSPFHKELYIHREVDNQIASYCKDLKPSTLKIERDRPKQICLVRDFSGSGKTTLSLQIALGSEQYFSTSIAANESDIDVKFVDFFNSLGEDYGLRELLAINKPIVFVIDSLDEANYNLSKKRKEVLSILKFIEDDLQKTANDMSIISFPLLIVFTIREDYWRDWESVFEGRKKNNINKRISHFGNNEISLAIENYSNCYNYNITNNLNDEIKRVLSIPINLLIFSEAYSYQGDIFIQDIWEGKVIDTYFTRKKEDITNRYISGFTSKIFFNLISVLAFHVVKTRNYAINQLEIYEIIRNHFHLITPYTEEVIQALVSEQILNNDNSNTISYHFRHSRFIEYLLAYFIVNSIHENNDFSKLDYFAELSFKSGIVQMFRVHDDIRHIGRTKFHNIVTRIDDYYAKSTFFMSKKLSKVRADLAVNDETSSEDLSLILKNINRNDDEEVILNAYFVVVAKFNHQPQQTVLDFFLLAFYKAKNLNERYKLIVKLYQHNLLLHDKVLNCIYHSPVPKEWEVYLGMIYQFDLSQDFKDLFKQTGGAAIYEKFILQNRNEDWTQTSKLLDAIILNHKIILGDS